MAVSPSTFPELSNESEPCMPRFAPSKSREIGWTWAPGVDLRPTELYCSPNPPEPLGDGETDLK